MRCRFEGAPSAGAALCQGRWPWRGLAPVVLAAAVLGVASSAGARPRPAVASPAAGSEVDRLIAEGVQAFDAGRFADALQRYLEARGRLTAPRPALEFAIARTYQQLGRPADARAVYEALLAQAKLPPAAGAKIRAAIDELRAGFGQLVVTGAPPGASVVVDGQPRGLSPLPPLDLPVGEHALRVAFTGYNDAEHTVTVGPGETVTRAVTLVAAAPAEPAVDSAASGAAAEPAAATLSAPPVAAKRLSPWTWVTLATGAALGVAGAVAYGLGERDHRQIASADGYSSPERVVQMSQPRADDLNARGDLKKTAGYALWGVGGAALASSVVLFVVEAVLGRLRATPPAASLAPAVPGGPGLSVSGAF